MSDRLRIGTGLVLVAVAAVLFFILRGNGDTSNGGDDGTPPASKKADDGGKPKPAPIPVIRLRGGESVGGVKELEVTSGERVRFRVTSDVAGEVHVHGYEDEKPVTAGGSVSFDFPADLEGGFEVELHHGGGENEIAELKVQPG